MLQFLRTVLGSVIVKTRAHNFVKNFAFLMIGIFIRLPVHVYYDDSFNSRFGSGVTTRITAIFTIVKAIYSNPSLTTVLHPDVIEMTYLPGETWTATATTLRYLRNKYKHRYLL